MKTCSRCKIAKPTSEFPRHGRHRDGLYCQCRACKEIADAARRQRPDVKVAHRDVNRRRRATGAWRAREAAGARKRAKRYVAENRARKQARAAILSGLLVKPETCDDCKGKQGLRIEAHHEDYSKPLDVVWLCGVCHAARHRERARGTR